MLKKKGPVLSLLAVQRSGSRAQRHTPHPYRPSGQERAHCDEHLVPPDVQPLARSPRPYVVARRPARPGTVGQIPARSSFRSGYWRNPRLDPLRAILPTAGEDHIPRQP